MDDWEKAYEEDRRRLAEGKDIVLDTRRGDAVANLFEEKEPLPVGILPTGTSGRAVMTDIASASFVPTPAAALPRTGDTAPATAVSREDEEEIYKFYSQYSDEPVPHRGRAAAMDDAEDERSQQSQLHDARFNLTCLPSEWNLYSLFGTKMGRRLFFAEVLTSLFKGFFGSKESLVACFVTPNCVYLGDVQTGAVIACIDIQRLREVHIFDSLAVGLRTLDAFDLFLQASQHTDRLVSILQKIAGFWKVNVRVVPSTLDQAKVFKKEMQLFNKKSHTWRLVEDPRTGLRIVNIPEQFAGIFAPIALKIVHWFGFIHQSGKDWKGSKRQRRRCAWVTATCFFVAREGGPGSDGRSIKHCAAMQYMTELYVGPGGELGIVAAAGPPQPPISVVFDSEEEKKKVLFIFQECYNYRNCGGSIKVTQVNSVEERIRLTRVAGETRPQLFLMRPQKELYEFLRGPSGRN
ncbi:uncharacterized protein Tco025E_04471 [Trypanosoma conorhini]|uniref:Uncharacterized protein n=1 Tax=Trypanosoma conorhini TaxID=83891 RepID=A0A3R7S0E5_9TRYP|nr:uncharacterized protein Tco025E_04471 [Trypanosoma conorhini]RNF18451.1 hypothetical protein Tco025E_04471 [Trypanosoma conorhini]